MSTWLDAWRNREATDTEQPVMELLVVAGSDAGSQFTLEGEEVLIGRGEPRSGHTSVIRLEDTCVSRSQAWLRGDAAGFSIAHIETASNPTLVNGQPITTYRLAVGDRIDIGRISMDVRARKGTNLSGLTEIMEGVTRENTQGRLDAQDTQPAAPPRAKDSRSPKEPTEVRPMEVHVGELSILRGVDDPDVDTPRVFRIGLGTTRIGRGEDVEVQIGESGVSRLHAEISVEGGRLVLRSKSQTNPTLVNGFPVLDQVDVGDGDEIQLADRVVLGVRLGDPARSRGGESSLGRAGLSQKMENKIDLDRSIEEFNVMGTFLDVDVVASRTMKGGSAKPEHIIVSFERFRAFVGGICLECDGQVLNSNGDELMCFFESASSAVLAGSAILERLDEFNRDRNLLSTDFRFRLGAHTGLSLVDLDAGVAYSEVLDTAGHIQKLADPNTLLISQATLDSLPREVSATRVGALPADGSDLYRLEGSLVPSDLEPSSS